MSSFQAQPGSGPEEPKTGLEIIKVEAGTGLPLAGAVFEVKTPEGDTWEPMAVILRDGCGCP